MTTKYHTKKNGDIKYYANHESAWNAASRLNEMTDDDGLWLFEADMNGWYVFFSPYNTQEAK